MSVFEYQELFPKAHPVQTRWRKLEGLEGGVSVGDYKGRAILEVDGKVLSALAAEAMRDVSHLYRPGHLQ